MSRSWGALAASSGLTGNALWRPPQETTPTPLPSRGFGTENRGDSPRTTSRCQSTAADSKRKKRPPQSMPEDSPQKPSQARKRAAQSLQPAKLSLPKKKTAPLNSSSSQRTSGAKNQSASDDSDDLEHSDDLPPDDLERFDDMERSDDLDDEEVDDVAEARQASGLKCLAEAVESESISSDSEVDLFIADLATSMTSKNWDMTRVIASFLHLHCDMWKSALSESWKDYSTPKDTVKIVFLHFNPKHADSVASSQFGNMLSNIVAHYLSSLTHKSTQFFREHFRSRRNLVLGVKIKRDSHAAALSKVRFSLRERLGC